jgi:hypothetical protein
MNSKILDEVQLLKLYLQRFPESATELAIAHLEDYLVLVSEYNRLTAQLKQLQRDLDRNTLTSIVFAVDILPGTQLDALSFF